MDGRNFPEDSDYVLGEYLSNRENNVCHSSLSFNGQSTTAANWKKRRPQLYIQQNHKQEYCNYAGKIAHRTL